MAVAISRVSNSHLSNNLVRFNFASSDVVVLNQHISYHSTTRKKCGFRHASMEYNKHSLSRGWLEVKRYWSPFHKARRILYVIPFASGDEGIAVNGTAKASSNEDMAEMRPKFNQSLQGENLSSGLVQSIHDAARAIELAIQEHSSSSKASWFSKAWLGVDKNAWVKQLSYQAAVYALLQAAIEISSRGDGRDKDTNISVQRSLSRQCAPLENIIQEELSAKQPATYDWFWSNQHPLSVKTYVDLLEKDPRFAAATVLCWKGESSSSSDTALLMLSLSCLAAVKKLGSTKVSCSQFFTMIPDTVGRLMDVLLDFVPIQKAYYSLKDIGLRREYLFHFGPRVATVKYNNDHGAEERAFWIDLIQNQLQKAIDREKIWSRLTTCESIEVLEKDLAIFGFFIALGRHSQLFLSANGVSAVDDQIEGIIRYLIGGSVLYYPQLASISSYQLFVEVVCEELEWLPFYGSTLADLKQTAESRGKHEGIPSREAISVVLDVCLYWMTSFIKYSTWPENPSNIKAARFLSRGHSKLTECVMEVEKAKYGRTDDIVKCKDQRSEGYLISETELDSFDKALESVEEALVKLENLLQELHVSNSNSGRENLKAACSDLERIRKLKKEAEFLEASFRAKAASLGQVDADAPSISSVGEQRQFSSKKAGRASSDPEVDQGNADKVDVKPLGFWKFLVQKSKKKTGPALSPVNKDVTTIPVTSTAVGNQDKELNEIRRFELLRHELIELEKRVQRSTGGSEHKEELEFDDRETSDMGNHMIVHGQKKNDMISKSIEKMKETSTDLWQGTQLLAIDVAAAMVLLQRKLTGDELTQKEKKALRRTLTDLASVVPIGFLMLLPVTAVGHAAMLAAIQRYVPALIPSTYGPERLNLLRQLEKVKEFDTTEISSEEIAEVARPSSSNP